MGLIVEYNVIGRCLDKSDTRKVVGYRIKDVNSGAEYNCTKEQLVNLVDKGVVSNCDARWYDGALTFKGKGIKLTDLPSVEVDMSRSGKIKTDSAGKIASGEGVKGLPDKVAAVMRSIANTIGDTFPCDFSRVKIEEKHGFVDIFSMITSVGDTGLNLEIRFMMKKGKAQRIVGNITYAKSGRFATAPVFVIIYDKSSFREFTYEVERSINNVQYGHIFDRLDSRTADSFFVYAVDRLRDKYGCPLSEHIDQQSYNYEMPTEVTVYTCETIASYDKYKVKLEAVGRYDVLYGISLTIKKGKLSIPKVFKAGYIRTKGEIDIFLKDRVSNIDF